MIKPLKVIYDESLKLVDNKNVFQRDILFLMEECFNITYNDIIIGSKMEFNDADFCEKLARLVNGEPVEYIVGRAPFYGNEFVVNQDTLIPRNETEELIEKMLNYIDKYNFNCPNIVDVGSGSGCIAITLDKLVTGAKVDSYDISIGAIEVSKINNKNLKANVNFQIGDCLKEAIKENKKYDIIISNPPYIDKESYVQDSVKNYEPHTALYAENHGLAIYERIFQDVKHVEKEKMLIGFEISPDLEDGLINLHNLYLSSYSYWFEKDMNGLVRFMFLKK